MIKAGIIGLGLIGGSIAKALKSRLNAEITAFNRSEKPLIDAYNEKIVDKYSSTDIKIFSECDIIFICTPVDKITQYVDKLIPYIKKECLITDVGSTKNNICKEMSAYKDIYFIGGHPMTGSEQTSYNASKEYLFENAYYILTPSISVPQNITDNFCEILKKIGAIPVVLLPDYHDHAVAAISHAPHIIASALVNMVNMLDGNDKYMHTLAAGGFKDITRIASSSPEMWNSICMENKSEILNVLKIFKSVISDFEKNLLDNSTSDVYAFFENAKKYRDSFSSQMNHSITKTFDLFLDVCDKPGIIATISTLLSFNNINIKNIGIINSREHHNGILQIVLETKEDKEKSISLLKEMNYTIYTK